MEIFPQHPQRATVLSELHIRPFQSFSTPHRFEHFAFAILPQRAEDERAVFSRLCASLGVEGPGEQARFHLIEFDGWTLRWELHAEFATYTWSQPTGASEPFSVNAEELPAAFCQMTPAGMLLVRVQLDLIQRQETTELIEALFDRRSLAVVDVAQGTARLATDFCADDTGCVRFLIEQSGLSTTRAGRLVQRVLELETYRCFALLGLPAARSADPVISRVEKELLRLSGEINSSALSSSGNNKLLHELTALSAELENQLASTSFRFGATGAYATLVSSRLEVIRASDHPGYISFSRFLRRRFNPAIATCQAIDQRQKAMADRLAHAVALLRTRIQSELEEQNRLLLTSMNRRSRMQLRLQQTVEGLSIAAVSYYVVGLVSYLAKGLKEAGLLPLSTEAVTALSVPVVIAAIWAAMHHARKSWGASKDD